MPPEHLRLFLLGLALFAPSLRAQDWQYYLNENIHPALGTTTAYVWIPPNADHVRGVIWAWKVVAEEEFVLDPAIRRAAMLERLAIVYYPSLPQFGFLQTAADVTEFNATMARLATLTGYPEMQYAPVIPFGHSTAGLTVRNQLLLMPGRTTARLTIRTSSSPTTWPCS